MTTKPDVGGWIRLVLSILGFVLALGASWLLMSDRMARAEEHIIRLKEDQCETVEMLNVMDDKLDEIILKLELHIAKEHSVAKAEH